MENPFFKDFCVFVITMVMPQRSCDSVVDQDDFVRIRIQLLRTPDPDHYPHQITFFANFLQKILLLKYDLKIF
jgi:hypothetical protein